MLRQRMYHFVIYQLSGIQAGIQAGHAAMEYTNAHYQTPELQQWLNHDKTVILLNGGTTNNDENCLGSINELLYALTDMGVKAEPFYEPDLQNAMTAIAFLVDERVWDREKYPRPSYNITSFNARWDREKSLEHAVKKTGIPKEVWELREFLDGYKLANN